MRTGSAELATVGASVEFRSHDGMEAQSFQRGALKTYSLKALLLIFRVGYWGTGLPKFEILD